MTSTAVQWGLVGGYTVAAAVIGAVGVIGLRGSDDRDIRLPYGVFVVGIGWWCLVAAIRLATPNPTLDRVLVAAQYVVGVVVPAAWVVFVYRYTNREAALRRWPWIGLVALIVVIEAVVLTNPLHGLWIAGFEPAQVGFPSTTFDRGPLYLFTHAVAYGLVAVGLARLLRFGMEGADPVRWRAIILTTGALAGVGMSLPFELGYVPIDTTPIGLFVFGVAITYAVYRYRFFELTPVARRHVFARLDDPVVVVDRNRLIVDYNDAARRLFGAIEGESGPNGRRDRSDAGGSGGGDDAIEQEAATVLPDAIVRLLPAGATGVTEEIELPIDGGQRWFGLRVSPMESSGDRFLGHAIVLRDITRVKRQNSELRRQNDRLDEFTSTISHDLRNPLGVAKGYAQTIDGDDPNAQHMARIRSSLERMDEMLDDLLTLARQGQAVGDVERLSVAAVAREAWGTVAVEDTTLDVTAAREVTADRERLRTVFENLFRNAVEHGSPSSRMRADSAVDGESANGTETGRSSPLVITVGDCEGGFYVADDGVGIPEDKRDHVFDHGYTTDEGGTGFGLSIVADIIAAHGWQIEVREGECGGARFEVTEVDTGEYTPKPAEEVA